MASRALQLARLLALGLAVWGLAAAAESARIVLRWKDVPGAVAYELQIARDNSFVDVVLQTRTTTPGYRWEQLPSQTHWWRVRSIDGEGRASEWSQPRNIALDSGAAPVPRAPADNAQVACGGAVQFVFEPAPIVREWVLQIAPGKDFGQARELRSKSGTFTVPDLDAGLWSWHAWTIDVKDRTSDKSPPRVLNVRVAAPRLKAVPDTTPGGSVTLAWAPAECARAYVLEAWSEAGERVTLSAPQPAYVFKTSGQGDYRWRVTGLDGTGKPGDWSAEGRFKARLPTPVPRGEVVGDGADLSWAPVPGAAGYRVEVASRPDFKALDAQANVTGTTWHLAPLPAGRYLWRVLARDAAGKGSTPSEPRPVAFGKLVALGTPVFSSPAPFAVVSLGEEVALAWSAVPEADRYVVEVDGHPLVPVKGTATRVAPLAEGDHSFRVRALGARDRDGTWSAIREVFAGVPAVSRVAVEVVGLELRVTLLDRRGRVVTGAAPRFAVKVGHLGPATEREGRWLMAWEPPPEHADVLLVDERAFHGEEPVQEPQHAWVEASFFVGGIFNGGAVASPLATLGVAVPLPFLDRRPFVELRASLLGESARFYFDGRPDVAGLTGTPVSLLLGFRQPVGAFEARLGLGPSAEVVSVSAGADTETRTVLAFEVAAALGRRFGPGLVSMEVGAVLSRYESPLAKASPGGFTVRLGYSLPLPPGGL